MRDQDQNSTATVLREAFDTSFAAAPLQESLPEEEFLLLGLETHVFAVRLLDVAGLQVDPKITPLPSPFPALRGVAALSGNLVPVYGLSALLGLPSSASSRWLLLSGQKEVLGFAFDRFLGHIQIRPGDIAQESGGRHSLPCITRLVPAGIEMVPVLDLPLLIENLRRQAAGLPKES